MSLRAGTDSKFLLKYLMIGLGCLAFGLWAIYDGFVAFPQQLPMVQAWAEIKSNTDLNDAEQDKQYKELAAEKNWPSKHPSKTPAELHQTIVWQYVFIAIGVGIGLPCLFWYLKNRGTWVEASETGIRSSWGQELSFDSVTRFDKKKWEKKGIGIIHYDTNAGPKKFVVDDLKYSRKVMDEIVDLLESKIPREMIINGIPESAMDRPSPETAESNPTSTE
jgi:hypothetical protein